jgi:hypothetical protein
MRGEECYDGTFGRVWFSLRVISGPRDRVLVRPRPGHANKCKQNTLPDHVLRFLFLRCMASVLVPVFYVLVVFGGLFIFGRFYRKRGASTPLSFNAAS